MERPLRPNAEDLEEVRRELAEIREASNAWTSSFLQADRSQDLWLTDAQTAAPDVWRRLHAEEAEAREDAARRDREAAGQAEDVRRLTERLGELRTDEAGFREALGEVESGLASLRAQIAQDRAALEDEERVKEAKVEALRRTEAKFRDCLGLRFDQAPDNHLKVVFTLIDPLEPQREFCFLFHTSHDKVYSASGCEPPVDGLLRLVENLNASNEVSAFFKAMRAEFRRIVSSGCVL